MAEPGSGATTAGSPPPPDAPDVSAQDLATVSLSFPPSPTAADICGFKFALPKFSIAFNLPALPTLKLPLPFSFSLSLVCDLSNPLAVETSFGGGRKPTGTEGMKAEEIDY
jgi:hypothetical protein